jgi:TnpA family transposase
LPDAYPEFATDSSDEELARDWTIAEADHAEVARCRGEAHRHRFALQLCALRSAGRFVDDFATIPLRIANHVGRQLGLPPTLFVEPIDRRATAAEHAQRIRDYLGYRAFDDEPHERLRQFLVDRARDGALSDALMGIAVTTLRAWRVELPGRSTLERLVGACAARGEEAAWMRVLERLPPEFCAAADGLLAVPDGDRRSALFDLKQYPPDARPSTIREYVERVELLRSLGVGDLNLAGAVGVEVVQHLADFGRRYDVGDLKRFAPAKRYAIVACFLVEAQKTTLDHLVEMHREYLTGMARRARNTLDQRHRDVRQRANKGLATMLRAMEIITDEAMPKESRIVNLYMQFDDATLRDAMTIVRDLHELGDHGYFDELLLRHSHFRRYWPLFIGLPFKGEPGNDTLLAAIELARTFSPSDRLPADAPISFAPAGWRNTIAGQRDRRLWELALAFAMRDALRSGDLYLAESRNHISFWNLIHNADDWQKKRTDAYGALNLPTDADRALDRLRAELDQATHDLASGLASNPFASLNGDRLQYKRIDGDDEPASVRELRRVVETHLPRIRIEDLLMEVDSWCGFSRELVPLGGHQPRIDNFYAALLAALVAHGTNLGIATMAQSTKGLSVETLHHVSRWYLRPETLKAANRVLVDYHHSLPITTAWGEGVASSSDGQRFGIHAPSLLASFYPRYFGYYDRAVTVYTHTSDQFSVFASRVISCSPREAIYVLDGFLENETVLRPREHYTDTHGSTEQLFGLCYLLGFSFMPRLKDLKDQQLYRLDRTTGAGDLAPIFRGGTVDAALIREQWDQLVRVAASLRNRTTAAHVILERLAGSSDRLAKALTMLGRVVKTTYVLRYSHDAEMRARVHRQLNRGESRHALARRIFFANQGAFRVGDYEEIMNKVSALSLLSNAVLAWNSVRFAETMAALDARGQAANRADLGRISPLAHGHVIPSGTYHFDRASDGRRPLSVTFRTAGPGTPSSRCARSRAALAIPIRCCASARRPVSPRAIGSPPPRSRRAESYETAGKKNLA